MPEPKPEAAETVDADILEPFQPPPKGSAAWDEWLDGPRPEAGRGRGQWLRARQLHRPKAKPERIAQSPMVAGFVLDVGHTDTAAAIAPLDAIIASAKSLPSDVIRAVEARQRILAKAEAEVAAREHGPLLDLRDALALVPESQRADALSALLSVGE